MEAIRRNGFDKETINNCYVTDDSRRLIGVVSLRVLVLMLGKFLRARVQVLERFCIPAPVIGRCV